jgi:hypothetical protein
MKPLNLTLNQKRFLIIWILFHSFALFVNVAHIYGTLHDGYGKDNDNTTVYLFCNTLPDRESDFWPFTSYTEESYQSNLGNYYERYYGGIFNSYGFPEYIFYMLLGLGIVFIPKLWK